MSCLNANVLNPAPVSEAADRTRQVLDIVQGWLRKPTSGTVEFVDALQDLARGFGARAAGVAAFLDGVPCLQERVPTSGLLPTSRWPWQEFPELTAADALPPEARALTTSEGVGVLAAAVEQPAGVRWLVWVEDTADRDWTGNEKAALTVAALAAARVLAAGPDAIAWDKKLKRRVWQRRREEAVAITGRLAHDFGNILTGVLGFAELALTQLPAGSTGHRHVHEIHQAAQKGARFIQELSLFSKRRPSAIGQASPAMVLAELRARLQAGWGPGIPLELDLPANLPAVALDTDLLRHVLGQLLDNAREAIEGSGKVSVTARVATLTEEEGLDYLGAPAAGECVEMAVRDTGGGMAPEIERRLWHELFVTSKPAHRGLGLAVVQSVLQAHRGGLRIESAPTLGTTVRVVLPVAAPVPAVRPANPSRPRGSGEKILVVDDDPNLLHVLSTILNGAAFRVYAASRADKALEMYTAAAGDPFRLVVADVIMPGMSGFDLARRLVAYDAKVNIVFITGQPPPCLAEVDPCLGQFRVLPKPFRPAGLLEVVRAALDQTASPGAASGHREAASNFPRT
jgi:signal transduction histidine kinase/CheY-like chemotaxis protein